MPENVKSNIFHSANEISFFITSSQNLMQIFVKTIEIGAVQRITNLVDLEKCCKMRVLSLS